MKFKTSELIGRPLDIAVMLALGHEYSARMPTTEWSLDTECEGSSWRKNPDGRWVCLRCIGDESPSTDWSLGGPISEREKINAAWEGDSVGWEANTCQNLRYTPHGDYIEGSDFVQRGPAELIAKMRCFVASKMGNEVEVPDGLL